MAILTPPLSGAPKRAEMLCNRCILGDPQTQWDGVRVGHHQPYLLGGPKEGGNAMSPLHSRGSQTKGDNSGVDASPLPPRGATNGRICYITLAYSGDPQTKGDKIRSGCLTFAFSGAQKKTEMLRHPCILGHLQRKGNKIRSGRLTLAFSGAHKWAGKLRHPCILGAPHRKGDKIRIDCLTATFWGAHKWAEILSHRGILRDP